MPTKQVELAPSDGTLDPRSHAYRPDLADLRLADRITASHFAEAVLHRCRVGRAPVRGSPDAGAPLTSELLHGEAFMALEIAGDWAWGWCGHDSYVGYVPAAALVPDAGEPTHRVVAGTATLFSQPEIKAPALGQLPMNALVRAGEPIGAFLPLADGGFVHARHVEPLAPVPGRSASSIVDRAALFLGTPYLWGGRTREGIDCSGLVQAALLCTGRPCPRDSDQQMAALGRAVDGEPETGDIVFFPGHVGIMVGNGRLLHANAWFMATVMEPLADVVARLSDRHPEPILGVRRL